MTERAAVVRTEPAYEPVTERPYCCVPAVLQMIQRRRKLEVLSQEETGYDLGLIVPQELRDSFTRVRTGPEPPSGFGTQTSRPEFSVAGFLARRGDPLEFSLVRVRSADELGRELTNRLERGDDVAICCSSRALFGDGDPEHLSLVQAFNPGSGEVIIVDPAICAPKLRCTTLGVLFRALKSHETSSVGGLWVFTSNFSAPERRAP